MMQLRHLQFAVSSYPHARCEFTPNQRLSVLILNEFLLFRPITNDV